MQQVAIIGGGFMGAMHARVYRSLPDARVVAVVDPRADVARAALASCGLADVPVFPDYDSASAHCDFSIADICLPTDLHKENVLRALADAKHVFCEKPIALTMEDAKEMVEAARISARQFMVGHCIRFWPEYVELKRLADSREYGQLLSLSMARRTGCPGYSADNWVNRPDRCLGAALDLHIHDTDFLVYLLGTPHSVDSVGIQSATGWNSIATHYHYKDVLATAEGAWNYPGNWGFQMRFSAVFEKAVLDFDSRGEPRLSLTTGKLPPAPVNLAQELSEKGEQAQPKDGYFHELAYFVNCIESGTPVQVSTGVHASDSLRVVLAEIESARTHERFTLQPY